MKKRNTKAIVSGLVSACVLACAPAVGMMTASAADDIVYGDANCDGSLSMADSVLIMQSMANPSGYGLTGTNKDHITDEGQNRGDVAERGNGITNRDALAIQKKLSFLSHIRTALPTQLQKQHRQRHLPQQLQRPQLL